MASKHMAQNRSRWSLTDKLISRPRQEKEIIRQLDLVLQIEAGGGLRGRRIAIGSAKAGTAERSVACPRDRIEETTFAGSKELSPAVIDVVLSSTSPPRSRVCSAPNVLICPVISTFVE